MYIPKAFREDDIKTLHAFMREYSFAALVTQQEGVPFASHLPFLLDAGQGPYGTLLAHMARANPQWHALDGAQEVLVIFQGPHTYISPSWYENANTVPTWNFAAVHAGGKLEPVVDEAALYDLLSTLIARSERKYARSEYDFSKLSRSYVAGLMKGIIGFRIRIESLYRRA